MFIISVNKKQIKKCSHSYIAQILWNLFLERKNFCEILPFLVEIIYIFLIFIYRSAVEAGNALKTIVTEAEIENRVVNGIHCCAAQLQK